MTKLERLRADIVRIYGPTHAVEWACKDQHCAACRERYLLTLVDELGDALRDLLDNYGEEFIAQHANPAYAALARLDAEDAHAE